MTVEREKWVSDLRDAVLTADLSGGPEHVGHLLIHGDHDVLLGGHVPVALLDLRFDPVDEVLLDYRRAHVHNPLLAHFVYLLVVGHVVEDVPVAFSEKQRDVSQR